MMEWEEKTMRKDTEEARSRSAAVIWDFIGKWRGGEDEGEEEDEGGEERREKW